MLENYFISDDDIDEEVHSKKNICVLPKKNVEEKIEDHVALYALSAHGRRLIILSATRLHKCVQNLNGVLPSAKQNTLAYRNYEPRVKMEHGMMSIIPHFPCFVFGFQVLEG